MFWSDFGLDDDWFRVRPGSFGNAGWWPSDVREVFSRPQRQRESAYPALNIWTNADEAVVLAEVPGVDPSAFDITVVGKSLTMRAERPQVELKEGEKFLRQERGFGAFSRTVELPFAVDSNKVDAQYKLGVLKVRLPRAEQDKPRKITIR